MEHAIPSSVKRKIRRFKDFFDEMLAFEDMLPELRAEDGRREASRFTYAMGANGYIPPASVRRFLNRLFAKS